MKLASEQLPNDGGFHIRRLVDEANQRLKKVGKHGKRATLKMSKSSLSLQFTFADEKGKKQRNPGLGAIPLSPKGILQAEEIAKLVTGQLTAGTFTWDWFNSLIGKDTSEAKKQLTCKEMVEQFKKHFFKQRKGNKTVEKSWYDRCRHLEQILEGAEKPLSLALVRQVVEATGNNSETRAQTLNGLAEFLKYFDIEDYKKAIKEYKTNNKIKRKKRNVPSDEEIIEVYERGFKPSNTWKNRNESLYTRWRFLYGLLATYGLRIHEAWNIANWDKPVILKNDDWVTVDGNNDEEIETRREGEDLVIPAILDPDNKDHILCIKHDTKTGYRMAIPLSLEGHDWLEEFNLLQPLHLPEIKDPLKRAGKNKVSFNCTTSTCTWFRKKGYGFTPHDLRHAYNHRGHQLGYNPKALADSLGHSMQMNGNNYLRHMSDKVKLQGLRDSMRKGKEKRSENELLKEENRVLKKEIEALKRENELLRTQAKMYEAIEKSQGNK